jgi:mono/diheme cytochrome c family protein
MKVVASILLVLLALVVGAVAYVRATGLDARGTPASWETALARAVRRYAVSDAVKSMADPVPRTADGVNAGLEHFADHCAVCHGNDGSGNTEMGRGLWPKAPDMRLPITQQLTDGELFAIIEHGVRFTGMPGWGTGNVADEQSTWQLVQFIRALPHLDSAQLEHMRALNPRSPEEVKQELEEQRFLNGQ